MAMPHHPGSHYPAIDHLLGQMRSHPERPWRLTECARLAGMHPTYFSEKFHQRTGLTLTSFLARQRVERARQLLRYTGLPISEIAFASGFRSLSQFNRVYKQLLGQTPSSERPTRVKPSPV
jgi:transcriptional regulator GlxA family with amidase domain